MSESRFQASDGRSLGPTLAVVVRELSRQPGVEVLGHVDDLSATVASTRVGIVPLMVAGGIRMKLLDFMAWRIPAVATSLAARGLGFTDGCGAFRRDTPEAFADAVIELLSDDHLWLDCERRGADLRDGKPQPANTWARPLLQASIAPSGTTRVGPDACLSLGRHSSRSET